MELLQYVLFKLVTNINLIYAVRYEDQELKYNNVIIFSTCDSLLYNYVEP